MYGKSGFLYKFSSGNKLGEIIARCQVYFGFILEVNIPLLAFVSKLVPVLIES